jgi:hypothetical protein
MDGQVDVSFRVGFGVYVDFHNDIVINTYYIVMRELSMTRLPRGDGLGQEPFAAWQIRGEKHLNAQR